MVAFLGKTYFPPVLGKCIIELRHPVTSGKLRLPEFSHKQGNTLISPLSASRNLKLKIKELPSEGKTIKSVLKGSKQYYAIFFKMQKIFGCVT